MQHLVNETIVYMAQVASVILDVFSLILIFQTHNYVFLSLNELSRVPLEISDNFNVWF